MMKNMRSVCACFMHGEQQKYYHDEVGINSRLDEIQAAVLRIKLPHLEEWIRGRQQKAERYESMIAEAGLTRTFAFPSSDLKAATSTICLSFALAVRSTISLKRDGGSRARRTLERA